MIAVAVRDVHAAAFTGDRIRVGIDGDVRRPVQQRLAAAFEGRVSAASHCRRVVAGKLSADLEQLGAAVVAPLLHDAIRIAADPDIVLVIDEAAVDAVRQNRVLARVRLSGRNQRRVTPGVRHIAFGIEFDHRWGRLGLERPPERAGVRVGSAHALRGRKAARLEATGHDDEVILRVDAGPAGFAGYPVVRQRLGPERIDLEGRRNQPFFRLLRAGDRLHADEADADGDA